MGGIHLANLRPQADLLNQASLGEELTAREHAAACSLAQIHWQFGSALDQASASLATSLPEGETDPSLYKAGNSLEFPEESQQTLREQVPMLHKKETPSPRPLLIPEETDDEKNKNTEQATRVQTRVG